MPQVPQNDPEWLFAWLQQFNVSLELLERYQVSVLEAPSVEQLNHIFLQFWLIDFV